MFTQPALKTIPNNTQVQMILFRPTYSVICAVGGKPFSGHIEIIYEPAQALLELEGFQDWLAALARESFTVESLCDYVFEALNDALIAPRLSVTVAAELTSSHGYVEATRSYER